MNNAMKHRIKSLWLPGLVISVAATMLIESLTKAGVKPRTISFVLGQPDHLFLYSFWLLALPPLGALGAWWSKRAGGGRWERALAGILPASPVTVVSAVAAFPVAFVLDSHFPLRLLLSSTATALLNWTIIPGAALFLGALPFLRQQPQPLVVSRTAR